MKNAKRVLAFLVGAAMMLPMALLLVPVSFFEVPSY